MSEQSGIRKKLKEKWKEAAQAVFPIIGIVLLLCFTIAPISPSVLLCFLMGAVLILVGMMFFTLGAEMSMTPMGERIGTCLTRSREPAGDRGSGIPSGVYRHHFRTGSPGSGGPGAGGAQYDADPVGGLRGWGLSGDRPPAYAVFHGPSAAPGGLLRRGICPGGLCAKGFFKRGL